MIDLARIKIKVENEQHSIAVQNAMFAAGYYWAGNSKKPRYSTANYLYGYPSGSMSYGELYETFEQHSGAEYELFNGELMAVAVAPKPPIGLRPKSVVDSLRKKEILEAMTRYSEAAFIIPKEWIDELTTLNGG